MFKWLTGFFSKKKEVMDIEIVDQDVVIPLSQAERDQWADKLVSGEYEQGIGYLQKDGKFCCLGVRAEMKGLDKKETSAWDEGVVTLYDGSISWLADTDLPRRVQVALAKMNDRGSNFDQIAEVIRKGKIPYEYVRRYDEVMAIKIEEDTL